MEKLSTEWCCNLTDAELQERKSSALAALKKQVLEKQEIQDGVVYTFAGNDTLLDQLIEFIKTERACCPFFKFELTIREEKNPVLLRITGPDGVKDFIRDELDF